MIRPSSLLIISLMICFLLFLNACNTQVTEVSQVKQILESLNIQNFLSSVQNSDLQESDPDISGNSMENIVEFRVQVPENTPPNETIYLSILDEVTGLALNSTQYPMEIKQSTENSEGNSLTQTFAIKMPFEMGSIIKYRYERTSGSSRVLEHFSDGNPVRYRLYQVNGTNIIEDVVSRWTDTEFLYPVGRIMGKAHDSKTSQPIPNLLISVGGSQTITDASGSFTIEGLPPGVHILVAYALDGAYHTFQQGARIAPDATTPAPLELSPSEYVDITFKVTVPENTPRDAPIRIAGDLLQLGNSFADLTGGISSIASRMPVLERLSDKEYSLTLSLPVGANISYKYTLGDGFWNAEYDHTGKLKLRQMIVPGKVTKIEDVVEAWGSSSSPPITFKVSAPASTPADDTISIQFKPLFGWTEPLPMWKLSENQWEFKLYSPLNLPGQFAYRYCRNNQCGRADDQMTPGMDGLGRNLDLNNVPEIVNDKIDAWINFNGFAAFSPEIQNGITPRDEDFWAGVQLTDEYHPSWMVQVPTVFQEIGSIGSNWIVLTPSWTNLSNIPENSLPIFQIALGSNPSWFDLSEMIANADEQGLNVAVYPVPIFQINADEWWQNSARDYSWWLVWFDQFRNFILHHADLAAANESQALIIGGAWLKPALPNGVLSDGTPSGVPADAENRWRELISEVRSRYTGEVLWALPYNELDLLPPFADEFDRIYLLTKISPESLPTDAEGSPDFSSEFQSWLQNKLEPFYSENQIPLILALDIASNPNLEAQAQIYEAILSSVQSYEWINGIISQGFYPPAALQDNTASIHGKPAEALLEFWFSGLFEESLE